MQGEDNLSGSYMEDLALIKQKFRNDDLITFREFRLGEQPIKKACLIFCEGLTDKEVIENNIIRPLMEANRLVGRSSKSVMENIPVANIKSIYAMDEIVQGITYGDSLLLLEGNKEAYIIGAKNFEARAITEPEGEKVLSGPREGFTEILMTNLGLVRRKLRTSNLKMRYMRVGEETSTQICIAYLEDVTNAAVLKELYHRLEQIKIDGVLDANYINELIRDHPRSPFRTMGYTERPDVVAAKLLEGRIALFIDGTPVVLTVPYLFIENFQSNEDYYLSYYYTSFARFLRIVGFFISIMVPAVYIAIVAFHQEMLPSPLLISIAIERESVPLPAALEAFIMIVIFEILRETALRMQTNVGQALSIVGALVLGQAAVEAKLVAAPVIIIVAMSGITSLLVPKMNAPILLVRFIMLALASSLGFLGVMIGFSLLLAHMLSLRSFGAWQIFATEQLRPQYFKDIIIRAPWYRMILRPPYLAAFNEQRQTSDKRRSK